jgi:hypothetical protein
LNTKEEKRLSIKSIESKTLDRLRNNKYTVHSIFRHVMNLLSGDHIISVVSQSVCMGPNRIQLNETLNFQDYDFKIADGVTITPNKVIVGNTELCYQSTVNLSVINLSISEDRRIIEVNKELRHYLQDLEKMNVLNYHNKMPSVIENYQFQSIERFLNEPTQFHLERIIGLGGGLTPLGDDIVHGYLMALNLIGQPNERLVNQALLLCKMRSNIISYNILRDGVSGRYSDDFKTFLNEFFNYGKITQIERIINFGDSSGIGILCGFSQAIKNTCEVGNNEQIYKGS